MVFLRVSDSVDVFLDIQNNTLQNNERKWREISYEVPPVFRPFRLVLVAVQIGVGVKDVRLQNVQCTGDSKEEATTEPWTDATAETTDPGTTEEWTTLTTDSVDTTDVPSATSNFPPSSSSVLPSALSALSTSTKTISAGLPSLAYRYRNRIRTRMRHPLISSRNPFRYDRNRRLPYRFTPKRSTKIHTPVTAKVRPSTSENTLASTRFNPQASPFSTLRSTDSHKISPTTGTPKETSSSTTPKTISSTTPKVTSSSFTSKATSSSRATSIPTPKVSSSSTTLKATFSSTTPKVTSSSITPKATSSSTTPKVTSSSITPKAASSSTTPKVTSSSTTPKATSSSTTPIVTSSSTTPKVTSSSTTPKVTSSSTTPQVTSSSSFGVIVHEVTLSSPVASTSNPIWRVHGNAPSASSRPTFHPSSIQTPVFSITSGSIAVTRLELPRWRVPSSATQTLPYLTPRVLRIRSTSTQIPTSTSPSFKSNQSMDSGPGPRFKVRTKYTFTESIETEDNGHQPQGVTVRSKESSLKDDRVTHFEVALLVIAVTGFIAGVFWCLRRRFLWLQSSRFKIGDSYSLQINYADDVGLDVLPSVSGGATRKSTANGRGRVEESSADGEKRGLRTQRRSTILARGVSTRLKGSNNYSELTE